MKPELANAVFALHPLAVNIIEDIAYAADGSVVTYDLNEVTAKAEADAQAQIDAKQTALSKLTALGLTQNDVKALLGL